MNYSASRRRSREDTTLPDKLFSPIGATWGNKSNSRTRCIIYPNWGELEHSPITIHYHNSPHHPSLILFTHHHLSFTITIHHLSITTSSTTIRSSHLTYILLFHCVRCKWSLLLIYITVQTWYMTQTSSHSIDLRILKHRSGSQTTDC